MNNVRTFEACNTIKTVAEATDDHRILHILRGVNNDLVAAEAKYHKSCFASYTSKSNLKHKTFKETQDESLYSLAFKELASSIESGIDEGKAYDMSSLLSMYQNSLQSKGVNGDSYTRQRLKLRLQNHFAERIVFHQPFDKRNPELVYSSKISLQDVINAAVDLHPSKQQGSSSNESSSDKTNYIFEAAKMIKNDIKQCNGICTRPLDVNDLNQETVRRIVRNRLYWLLRWIIGCDVEDASTNAADERRILSIAQDIIHCSSNARVKTPKHIGLAMSVHHSTGSKQIVTLLNRMGYCSSYDERKSVDTSLASEVLAKSEEYGTVLPSNISLGSFVQIAADNNDFNEETLDVKDHSNVSENVKELECQVQQVVSVFNEFKEEARAKSKLFAFWEEYGTMVDILLQFIKAERTVYNCDNEASLQKNISLHRIPYFEDQRPEAKARRKTWVDFVLRYRDKWQVTKNSVICSEHFRPEDYCNMFSKLEGQTAAIRPRLKRDSVGISVVPSIHKPKEVTTMSARSRRMVLKETISAIKTDELGLSNSKAGDQAVGPSDDQTIEIEVDEREHEIGEIAQSSSQQIHNVNLSPTQEPCCDECTRLTKQCRKYRNLWLEAKSKLRIAKEKAAAAAKSKCTCEDRSRKHKVPRQDDDHEEQPENTVMYSEDIYSNEESDEEHYEPETETETTETESDTGAASSQWSRLIGL
ncbi:hypothetical protein QZH41_018079 [Actinostola sp. cb2023]|nr:hypothetical protein QZH41_018079 [Actinostola sp. cb2023]